MANASSSAARISDAASADPLAGIEPANDAYGSLAALASRPKPKKKPVLVLDADELAKAHELFQVGAAGQLEDADQIERRQVTLGLAPLGSDLQADDTPDEDEADYSVEADAPAPDDVLGLTRAAPEEPDAPRTPKNPKKSMVALPPDGDPALDAVEPFVPLAPEEDMPVSDDAGDDAPLDIEPVSETPAEEPLSHPVAHVPPPAPEPPAEMPVDDDAPAEPASNNARITRVEEEELDGTAFMRKHERRNVEISGLEQSGANSLRARLVREEDKVIEEEEPSAWARFTGWLSGLWNRFLG